MPRALERRAFRDAAFGRYFVMITRRAMITMISVLRSLLGRDYIRYLRRAGEFAP